MKWGLNRAFTVNKYSFYATASANPSTYGDQPSAQRKKNNNVAIKWFSSLWLHCFGDLQALRELIKQVVGWRTSSTGTEMQICKTGIRHPRYGTCEYTQPAFFNVIFTHSCLWKAVAWLILIKRMKASRDWLPDVRMCDFCHCAKYNGQSMNTVNEGKH